MNSIPSNAKRRILLVEDDRDVSALVKLHLIDFGFEVDIVEDGQEGLREGQEQQYALIVLDVMLPKLDGLEVCKALRKASVLTPILMLTCRNSEIDKVLSLECGADDHLSKPFGIDELRARVRALIRRSTEWSSAESDEDASKLSLGNVSIDLDKREVKKRGLQIELTSKEFDLLSLLARSPGKVFSRELLLDKIWDYHAECYEHTVTSHINRLRTKIEENPSDPQIILTVRGVGYKAVGG